MAMLEKSCVVVSQANEPETVSAPAVLLANTRSKLVDQVTSRESAKHGPTTVKQSTKITEARTILVMPSPFIFFLRSQCAPQSHHRGTLGSFCVSSRAVILLAKCIGLETSLLLQFSLR